MKLLRTSFAGIFGLMVSLLLFWLMQAMIAPPENIKVERREFKGIEITRSAPEPEEEPSSEESQEQAAPPPPAPPAPPGLKIPGVPVIASPSPVTVPTPSISMPSNISGEMSLAGSFGSSFGGFAAGSGAGLGGFGSGQGFKGDRLVPRSTRRPQIPQMACDKGIEGWVQAVFIVTKAGKVRNIRIVDSRPRGIFETPMIEGLSHWVYPRSDVNREVIQEFEFKVDDCKYNWNG